MPNPAGIKRYSFPPQTRKNLLKLIDGVASPDLIPKLEDVVGLFRSANRRKKPNRTLVTQEYTKLISTLTSAIGCFETIRPSVLGELGGDLTRHFPEGVQFHTCLAAIKALSYEVSMVLNSRKRRGQPRTSSRDFFLLMATNVLRRSGFELTISSDGPLARVSEILLDETRFPRPVDLYPIVKKAVVESRISELGEATVAEILAKNSPAPS